MTQDIDQCRKAIEAMLFAASILENEGLSNMALCNAIQWLESKYPCIEITDLTGYQYDRGELPSVLVRSEVL